MRKHITIALLGLTVLAALPLTAGAQQFFFQSARRAWLGLSYESTTTGRGTERTQTIVITDIVSNSPAERAGLEVGDTLLRVNDIDATDALLSSLGVSLKPGDEVVRVNGAAVALWEEFVQAVRRSPDRPLKLEVRRGDAILHLSITPQSVREGNEQVGRVGAAYRMAQSEIDQLLTTVSYAPGAALIKAANKTWETSTFSLKMLANMLTGDVSWKGISGPVTIASYAGQSAHIGLTAFLSFLALVSISLGVLNLLPVPVLDGGHLLYYVLEILKGSPVSERAMEAGQRIGLILLGLLMLVAFYNDFHRFITG